MTRVKLALVSVAVAAVQWLGTGAAYGFIRFR